MIVFARIVLMVLVLVGCRESERQVVVYTALDQQFSEPILDRFEQETGINVEAVYDTEAVKTVGLVNRLLAEKERPVADVFWNNEIVRTIQLKREGATKSYVSPAAETIPDKFKDPDGHWAGFGARARVLLANTNRIPDHANYPGSVQDLIGAQWRGQAGFAKPLFGTTSTHAAIIWERLGADESMRFWQMVMENAEMYAGNAQARDAAASGEMAWALTDTDDAHGAILDEKPVEIVYPDQGDGQEGMVMIPNTVALISGAPHEEEGKALIDYLLSEEVEAALAQSRSAQVPVRETVPGPGGLPPLEGVKMAEIDWEAVADALPASQAALTDLVAEQ